MRSSISVAVVLLLGAVSIGPTIAYLDTQAVQPADFTNADDRELGTALVDPGDPEEAVLEIVAEAIPSCVGVPTLRLHATYGSILQAKVSCLDATLITQAYHNAVDTYYATGILPSVDEVRSDFYRALSAQSTSTGTPQQDGNTSSNSTLDDGFTQQQAAPSPTPCSSRPSSSSYNRGTQIRFAFYYDPDVDWVEYRDEQISYAWNYLVAKTDGAYAKHADHPEVNFCVTWSGAVPSGQGGQDGDVSTSTELSNLANYEQGFLDRDSDFVIVMGKGEIRTSGGSDVKGLQVGEDLSTANLEAGYFQAYAYGTFLAGVRIMVHEFGHVFSLGHSICDDGPHASWNDYMHMMALSSDRDASCKPYPGDVWHHHFNFKPSDATAFETEHVAFCTSIRGSSC